MNKTRIIPLAMAPSGQKFRVVSIGCGRGLQHKLISMGLGFGKEVEVIRSGRGGPFLITVGESRIAIGRGIANKIMVTQNNLKENILL